MSIKYEIQSIKNSQGTGKEQHFARIFEDAPMSAQQLESHIQSSCSLTKGDVEATLSALRECMIHDLSHGHRFYIPSIGYFHCRWIWTCQKANRQTRCVPTI